MYNDGKLSPPVILRFREFDQDRDRSIDFKILIDYSYDGLGFFRNRVARSNTRRAADDWAYYFANMNLDQIGRGREQTWIWNRRRKYRLVRNNKSYSGFLLYGTSFESSNRYDSPARGAANRTYHTVRGRKLAISRSGMLSVKPSGIPGTNSRWGFASRRDIDRWKKIATGSSWYAAAKHELGHALGFSGSNNIWKSWTKQGYVGATRVTRYLRKRLIVRSDGHTRKAIDPLSRVSTYGNSSGRMPPELGLITMVDLLMMEGVGYKLRETSPFARLRVYGRPPRLGGGRYVFQPRVYGGVPIFRWSIDSGRLPSGLRLDPFTGRISGRTSASGNYSFRLRLRDSYKYRDGVTADFTIGSSRSKGPAAPRGASRPTEPGTEPGRSLPPERRTEPTGKRPAARHPKPSRKRPPTLRPTTRPE